MAKAHKKNQAIYYEMLRTDNLFAPRVFYIIDIRMQNFFCEAQLGVFATSPINFSTMYEYCT